MEIMIYIVIVIIVLTLIYIYLFKRNINIWVFSYCVDLIRKPRLEKIANPINIVFCFVDHFEPLWSKANNDVAMTRVDKWISEYPKIAGKHKDSNGKRPQHTFFYPMEKYQEEFLDMLAKLCKGGYGDVEIHIHHDNDNAKNLKKCIGEYKQKLVNHGFLKPDVSGIITYGFVHGNWALDNSRKDGKWCGINNEITVLKETGCYADFTLPSAPSDTQTSKINSIYYAKDDPDKPKSHNTGINVEVGRAPGGDLMIIQGPLCLNWKNRKWGIFPRIENGEIAVNNPPSRDRVDLWIRQHIHVKGAPNWIFVKVHTHGCQEQNMEVLLGKPMDDMFTYLETKYNDGVNYQLNYVTAREMYDLIKKIEAGGVA